MKLAISALLLGSACAYTIPPMATRAVAAKAPVKVVAKPAPKKVVAKATPKVVAKAAPKVVKTVAKAAPKVVKAVAKAAPKPVVKAAPKPKAAVPKPKPVVKAAPKVILPSGANVPKGPKSEALPWLNAPYTLDGSFLGDAGFDPFGFTTTPVGAWWEGNAKGNLVGLKWYREAELMHGRIAQLAALGFVAPALFGTFPGNELIGEDAYNFPNPLEAYDSAPGLAKFQIILFLLAMEFRRINIIESEGASYIPGDHKLGPGEGRWNPFKLAYTPAQYEVKQLQELNHCRAAMLGVFGLWAQAARSGESIVDQLSTSLAYPEYTAKAGYFFPEGI